MKNALGGEKWRRVSREKEGKKNFQVRGVKDR